MGKKEYQHGKFYSLREIKQFIEQEGWTIEPKGATGHLVARKEGINPFDIPSSPSKKTQQIIFKLIGLKR